MQRTRSALLALAIALLVLTAWPDASQPLLVEGSGRIGLGLMLRRLANVGVFLETTAHPDDEHNGLHAMLNRGKGYRTVLATATRGTGGQNEIGPELFESLAVLRTEELAAAHKWDGSEQYFARAIDFGYSFSVDETFEKWGRAEILADYVRLIRMIRPDVVLAMRPDGEGGGQHHQASARITIEAFRAAADPSRFPEQAREGLRPWQPRKLYVAHGSGTQDAAPAQRVISIDTEVYDPLLGQTYAEIGSRARSNHKCQGMEQLLALPGPAIAQYRLADASIPGALDRVEASLFDGLDTTITGLVQYAAGPAPEALRAGLAAVAREVERAQRAFDTQTLTATLPPLTAGLTAVRSLLTQIGTFGLSESAAYEIGFRLRAKEQEFQRAILLAQGLRMDALADDGLVVAGQPVTITLLVANRGGLPVQIEQAALEGFEGDGGCRPGTVASMGVYRCEATVRVPARAPLTTPYWQPDPPSARYVYPSGVLFGAPFQPTPFRATVDLIVAGSHVSADLPVEYRYAGTIFSGEKRMELKVVPRLSVRIEPELAVIAAQAVKSGRAERQLRVTVTNNAREPTRAEVRLNVPPGWQVTPGSVAVEITREDESEAVRFTVLPPATAPASAYAVRAAALSGGEVFDWGHEVIEYPHTTRRHRIVPAVTTVKVLDVRTAPNLRVGYVMGVGDLVPQAIQQLGAGVDLLDRDALAWGNLSQYDAIVTGVRAYERRADLRAYNGRLLEYARAGGVVLVQYNKFEFNSAQYGPLPAKVSSNRITDEQAPVEILVPGHPVFNLPNPIGSAAWAGWVQERGLYFLGEKDPAYVDLLQLEDPFPSNSGPKRGALVEATVGKGRWIYIGLNLWRQLPAGTDGAYQLLANLLSVGRAGAIAPAVK